MNVAVAIPTRSQSSQVRRVGDPLELSVRGGKLSLRKKEALGIEVER